MLKSFYFFWIKNAVLYAKCTPVADQLLLGRVFQWRLCLSSSHSGCWGTEEKVNREECRGSGRLWFSWWLMIKHQTCFVLSDELCAPCDLLLSIDGIYCTEYLLNDASPLLPSSGFLIKQPDDVFCCGCCHILIINVRTLKWTPWVEQGTQQTTILQVCLC